MLTCPTCSQRVLVQDYPEYRIWKSMIARCHDPRHVSYPHYGARGIFVCEPWRESFWVFLSDMGRMPEGYSLERINPNSAYYLDNCKWIPAVQQNSNKRNSRYVILYGERMIVADAARKLNMKYSRLNYLLKTNQLPEGLTLECLEMPSQA